MDKKIKKNIKTKYGNCYIRNGYYVVTSVKEGNRGKYLHRLIFEDKYGKIPEWCQVYHIDGDKLNNNINNLTMDSKNFNKNNTGIYRVSRVKSKKYKSGFCYVYTYTKDKKQKKITSKNLKILKEKVLNKGLEWKNLPT